ncbi:class I SAM-dependent methyltransferase [Halomicrococcus gelatinilyticus]|uniref:class I SAM-dependent methyltransferase n=1 Tax=Halomicrococcus gelatinilyticus TaxID=1702103 RepID=UPI002E16289A
MTDDWWNDAYDDDPPWDVGRPQPALVRLVEDGVVDGRVLDVGCGTGTNALYLAEHGHPVTGVDVSERAIEQAREKARRASDDEDRNVRFRVADALDLSADLGPFDSVVDSGTFHVFEDEQRGTYVDNLAAVLRSGGHAFVLAFGNDAPDDWGPNLVSRDDVTDAFSSDDWRIDDVRETVFLANHGDDEVAGLLAVVERR